jgi:hypothetical protein
LVVGADNNSITSSSRHIHPAFNNRDRVAYLRSKLLQEIGLNYEDGNSLLGLIEFQSKFGSFESSSINLDNMHFSVMTNFMNKKNNEHG